MYDMKALYEAHSVEEAVALRLEHPEAQIIAGGSDVLVQMREGKRAGAELISIYGIDAMRGICIDEDGNIRIGSLTSFSHITRDPIIRKYINVLGEAVDMVGGPQIRNIGTIGGNTCNGVTGISPRLFFISNSISMTIRLLHQLYHNGFLCVQTVFCFFKDFISVSFKYLFGDFFFPMCRQAVQHHCICTYYPESGSAISRVL